MTDAAGDAGSTSRTQLVDDDREQQQSQDAEEILRSLPRGDATGISRMDSESIDPLPAATGVNVRSEVNSQENSLSRNDKSRRAPFNRAVSLERRRGRKTTPPIGAQGRAVQPVLCPNQRAAPALPGGHLHDHAGHEVEVEPADVRDGVHHQLVVLRPRLVVDLFLSRRPGKLREARLEAMRGRGAFI